MKSSFEKKSLAFAIIVLFFGISIIPSMVAERPVLIETIYVDDDNTDGQWDKTEKHSLDYENDGLKKIQLKGECYEFSETHFLIELNRIGPFWFSCPSSVLTFRFREDFELIVDGVVQDLEPPMTIFVFRFRGFCPPPIYYRYINDSKKISVYGSCEEYLCFPTIEEDNIHETLFKTFAVFIRSQ